MKIVFNTDQIYLHGGIEKTIATRANYFANLPNVEVYIITTEQNNELPCYVLDEKIKLIDLGITYNRSLSYLSKANLGKVLLHFHRQKALFTELQPNVIISPNFNFDHFWLPFIHKTAKVIKERHGSRYFESNMRQNGSVLQRLNYIFQDWIDIQYDHIVVLNSDEKKYIKSKNAVIILNSILVPTYTAKLNTKKVISAGRISPVKAFDELIQAWEIVNEKYPDWELDIYGDDYLGTKDKLQQLIDSKNLQESVYFKGSVADLQKTMLDYSIYAMSSETECFPMVLLEALSVGLPIVSYDCPNGPRNILIDNEDGFLADYKNSKNLAEKLMILMRDDDRRIMMGGNAKNNVTRFSNEEVMKLWHKLLNLSDV